MAHKPVGQVTEVNVYLNDKGNLESTSKTQSILVGSNASIVWVKHRNSLEANPDALIRVDRTAKTIGIIKKYQTQVNQNSSLQDFITNLKELGYSLK